MRMRRTLLSFITLLALASLVLASACSGSPSSASKAKPTPTPLPRPVTETKPTYPVQRGDVTAQVQFSARIIPAVQEELFFRTDGRLRRVYVRSGDVVKKGQVLADLVSLDQMESQAAAQDLNLRRAEINYEMTFLRQQRALTLTPNWDRSYDIDMKLQAYEVELAQIALEETKLQNKNLTTAISDAQITATIDGKVLSMSALEGQETRAFSPMITIGDDSVLEFGATLTTTQMQDLGEGMAATIELTSRPGEKIKGKVRTLPYPFGTGGSKQTGSSQAGAGKSTDTTTRVTADDPAVMKSFRLGDLVTVTVIRESRQNVLWLPPAAIRTFEGRNFVVIKTEGLPKRQDVKIGIKNEERVEIIDGLQEGQVVVAP